MANNKLLPATGTGTAAVTQATDEIAGVDYPLVKLVDGTEDSTTRILAGNGTAAGALRVTVASDSTGVVASAGTVAHGTTDGGNPVKVGAKVETSPATVTLEQDGDRTDLYADADGLLLTKPYTAFGDILSERITDTAGTSVASAVFTAVASSRNMITTFIVYNDSTTNGFLDIRDGTAGSVIMTIPLPAKGGAVINLPIPLRQPTANTALAYDVSAALTTVYITTIGFKSKA